jgi:predicted Zn-dependent protease
MFIRGLDYSKKIFIYPVILSLILMSCATNPVTGKSELMLISESKELEIGKEAIPSLTWDFGGHYRDRELESYLGDIVKKLWAISERSHLPVQFYVQNTSVPNAFALPGYVAITRGLLSDMENEAQFAAVMGHEIGHVMARHTAHRLSQVTLQQFGLSIGSAALKDTQGGDLLLAAGQIGSGLLLLKFSRGQEIQADRLGVKYMSVLGYDPHEALSAHDVLQKSVDGYLKRLGKSRGEDNFISNLLSTHPRHEVRIAEIQDMINELPPYTIKGDGKFSNRFMKATASIRKINKIYYKFDKAQSYYQDGKFGPAEGLLNEAISNDSSQPPFHNLMGMIRLQQKNTGKARLSFQKALALDSGFQPSVYGMGLVHMFEGQYARAIESFRDSLKLYPGHASSYFGLGKSYYKNGQYSKAVPYLADFAKAVPKHPEVHGLLGICLEKTGDVSSAVIAYKNQIAVAPNTELGIHAKQRLTVLAPLQ